MHRFLARHVPPCWQGGSQFATRRHRVVNNTRTLISILRAVCVRASGCKTGVNTGSGYLPHRWAHCSPRDIHTRWVSHTSPGSCSRVDTRLRGKKSGNEIRRRDKSAKILRGDLTGNVLRQRAGDSEVCFSWICEQNKQVVVHQNSLPLTNVTAVSGVSFLTGAGVGQSALHVPPTLIPAHSWNQVTRLLQEILTLQHINSWDWDKILWTIFKGWPTKICRLRGSF